MLERIYKAILKLMVPTGLEETYAVIVDEAMKLVGGDAGRVVLEEDGELNVVYTSSPLAFLPQKVRKNGFVYTSFNQHRAYAINKEDFAHIYPDIVKLGIESALFIPLSFRGKTLGVMVIESYRRGQLTAKDLTVLKLYGAIASLKIRNAQLYEETKKSLENRDLFISLAAHELRTPITTIYGYSQLLFERTKDEDSVESRWISSLHAESYRLTLLTKDLLEINRIKAGQLQYVFKECALKDAIGRAMDNFRFNFPQREIIFEDGVGKFDDTVIGDFDKLLQVLINLLDNAAKFSNADKKIILRLKFKSPNFIIQVKDQGKGIPAKDLPKVFEGFYKEKDTINEGMGLGLFLSKNIVDAHRGSIHMHSRVGKGTLVEVQLPRANI